MDHCLMASLSLAERIRIASQNVSLAWVSFDIWWTYANRENRPEYHQTMIDYSEFFRFDENAHLVNMIMLVSSLYDPTKNTITIRSLINKAVTEGHRELKGMIAVADGFADDPKIQGVLLKRNKLYAHRDDDMTMALVYQQADMSADDYRGLIEQAHIMIDRVAEVVGGPRVVHNTIVGEHVAKMLNDLGR